MAKRGINAAAWFYAQPGFHNYIGGPDWNAGARYAKAREDAMAKMCADCETEGRTGTGVHGTNEDCHCPCHKRGDGVAVPMPGYFTAGLAGVGADRVRSDEQTLESHGPVNGVPGVPVETPDKSESTVTAGETAMSHTPGPWFWEYHPDNPDHVIALVDEDGIDVLMCSGDDSRAWGVIGAGDASLIQTAPDLLVALKRCLSAIEMYGNLDDCCEPARAAIAKAEGR